MGNMMAAEEALMMAYYREDPWGDHRADIRSAQISQILWNANCSKKEKAKKLVDFLPFYRKKPKEDPDVGTSIKSAFSKLIMGKK
jgi:hypothetical protein